MAARVTPRVHPRTTVRLGYRVKFHPRTVVGNHDVEWFPEVDVSHLLGCFVSYFAINVDPDPRSTDLKRIALPWPEGRLISSVTEVVDTY